MSVGMTWPRKRDEYRYNKANLKGTWQPDGTVSLSTSYGRERTANIARLRRGGSQSVSRGLFPEKRHTPSNVQTNFPFFFLVFDFHVKCGKWRLNFGSVRRRGFKAG